MTIIGSKPTSKLIDMLYSAFETGQLVTTYTIGAPSNLTTVPVGPDTIDKKALNIGCGTMPMVHPNWINADVCPGESVDMVFDSQGQWPIEDGALSIIYASHVIEHLDDPEAFFREAKRCLHPGGIVCIRVPHPLCGYATGIQDHKRPMSPEFFYSLEMNHEDTQNLQEQGRKKLFHTILFIHVIDPTNFLAKWWIPAKVKNWAVHHLFNICQEFWVYLRPCSDDPVVSGAVAIRPFPRKATAV